MKETLLKWIAGLAVAFSQTVSAVPITDTVIVGTQEWAQVDLFTNVSWDTLNTQCPAGVCSLASVVNGYDLAGWTWASVDLVQSLFNSFTGASLSAPSYYDQVGSSWAPAFLSMFRPTDTYLPDYQQVIGWSSTTYFFNSSYGYDPYVVDAYPFTQGDEAATEQADLKNTQSIGIGAWLVRDASPAPAPAPATLALFGAGLASLWVTRRGRGTKV